ncbi:hypothetical protein GQ457_10G010500 [Hibiscus cannabinus]
MAELHHMSHEHPLVFNEDTSSPSDATTYDCAGCAEKVPGSSYSCGECGFYLHKKCAVAPSEIHHPAHRDHPLLLLLLPPSKHSKDVYCRFCTEELKGFVYHCSSCEFYLDFNCALLPRDAARNIIQTLHVLHQHPLISINPFRFNFCNGCLTQIKDDASYACFDCGISFHKKCLELPTEIHHPCHRKHQLLLVFLDLSLDHPSCNLCLKNKAGFVYRCVPCNFNIHVGCARSPPVIEDKSHHEHPFTLLLRPNNPFNCDACDNQGNHVSYTCSTCNIQVHRDCISLPRHIRLNLHPHPISHYFFLCIDHHDSREWDCRICYKKVNIEHGCYYCPQPGCDFAIHVECSIQNKSFYGVVEVENPDEFEESDWLYEPKSCITRVIKEIEVGNDVIAEEIVHVSHEHNLIFSNEIEDKKYCNGCVLPVLSSFYYCSHCDFFLHKNCVELPRMRRVWFDARPWSLLTDDIFRCCVCGNDYKPHYLFFQSGYEGECNACKQSGIIMERDLNIDLYKCKDCIFSLHMTCIPHTVWHKYDVHCLPLAYQDLDDYPLAMTRGVHYRIPGSSG